MELLACLEGLDLAIQHSQLLILIESDCSQLVAAVRVKTQDRSPYMHIISEIKELDKIGRICTFVKVDHRQVQASHCLANYATTEHCNLVWFESGPDCLLRELELELNVATPV